MPFKNFREESRLQWGSDQERDLDIQQINCGSLLRIADSLEAVAKNYRQLIEDRDRYARWYKNAQRSLEQERKRAAAYKSLYKRAKERQP